MEAVPPEKACETGVQDLQDLVPLALGIFRHSMSTVVQDMVPLRFSHWIPGFARDPLFRSLSR